MHPVCTPPARRHRTSPRRRSPPRRARQSRSRTRRRCRAALPRPPRPPRALRQPPAAPPLPRSSDALKAPPPPPQVRARAPQQAPPLAPPQVGLGAAREWGSRGSRSRSRSRREGQESPRRWPSARGAPAMHAAPRRRVRTRRQGRPSLGRPNRSSACLACSPERRAWRGSEAGRHPPRWRLWWRPWWRPRRGRVRVTLVSPSPWPTRRSARQQPWRSVAWAVEGGEWRGVWQGERPWQRWTAASHAHAHAHAHAHGVTGGLCGSGGC